MKTLSSDVVLRMKKKQIVAVLVVVGVALLALWCAFGLRTYSYYTCSSYVYVVASHPFSQSKTWHYVDENGQEQTTENPCLGGLLHRPSIHMKIPWFTNPYKWAPPYEAVEQSFLETFRAQGHIGGTMILRYGNVSNEAEVLEIAKQEASHYASYQDILGRRSKGAQQPAAQVQSEGASSD